MTISTPSHAPHALTGPLLVLAGAALFGTKAIVVKCAYPLGVDAVTLLTLRMVFSLPVFAILAWHTSRSAALPLPIGVVARCCLFGLLGYYFSSFFDFEGLRFIGVGLERMVLCIYPVLVVLVGALVLGQRLTRVVVWSLVGCLTGVLLTYAGAPSQAPHAGLGISLVGCSAVTYAVFVLGSGESLRTIPAQRFMSIAMTAACMGVIANELVVCAWRGGWDGCAIIFQLQPAVYLYGALLALACTVAPALLMAEGLKRVGAQHFVIIGAIGPVTTVALGWLVLDEHVTPLNAAGMILTVACSITAGLGKPGNPPARTASASAAKQEPPRAQGDQEVQKI